MTYADVCARALRMAPIRLFPTASSPLRRHRCGPHTTAFMSSYYYMCVLMLLYVSSCYYICVLIPLYVSSSYYICVLLPYICAPPLPPRSSGIHVSSSSCIFLSSYYCTCVLILHACALPPPPRSLLRHTYVSSFSCISVLILLHMCPHTTCVCRTASSTLRRHTGCRWGRQ